jgi:hypothetical protein
MVDDTIAYYLLLVGVAVALVSFFCVRHFEYR